MQLNKKVQEYLALVKKEGTCSIINLGCGMRKPVGHFGVDIRMFKGIDGAGDVAGVACVWWSCGCTRHGAGPRATWNYHGNRGCAGAEVRGQESAVHIDIYANSHDHKVDPVDLRVHFKEYSGDLAPIYQNVVRFRQHIGYFG